MIEPVHRFNGMETETGADGIKRYRGRCACGHAEPWTADKDEAWERSVDHYLPIINALIAVQPRRICMWCQYGRCIDCMSLAHMSAHVIGDFCICTHPGLS